MSRLSEAIYADGRGLNDLITWGIIPVKIFAEAITLQDPDASEQSNVLAFEIIQKCEEMEEVVSRFMDEAGLMIVHYVGWKDFGGLGDAWAAFFVLSYGTFLLKKINGFGIWKINKKFVNFIFSFWCDYLFCKYFFY